MSTHASTRDVSGKAHTLRTARAAAVLRILPSTAEAIRSGNVPKADPLGTAKVAAIQAAKQTSLLIPFCHQVPLDFIDVGIELGDGTLTITAEVKAVWKTGVEMEALVAASSAALTLYDMLKIIDERMEISSVRLLEKKGGKSSYRGEKGETLKAAVIVVSDSVSKGVAEDVSGKLLVGKLGEYGVQVPVYKVLPDERAAIEGELRNLADSARMDFVFTTGGTGVGPRDVTPEATAAVIDRRLDGVEEALRSYGQSRIPTAMLSRAIAGVRGKTLIVNFPGSKGGVEDGVAVLFPSIFHVFRMLRGEKH